MDAEIKQHYEEYFAKEKEFLPLSSYDQIKFLKLSNPRGKLLDIACGNGYFLKNASDSGLEVSGVDLSFEGIKIAHKILGDNTCVCVGEGENLPFKSDYFDYVTCLGSLEHFTEQEKAIRDMLRVGKKEAQFVIIVPNSKFNYKVILTGKFGTWQKEFRETLRSKKEWTQFFEKNGLQVERVTKDDAVRPKWRKLKLLILKLIPLQFTYNFVFICSRKNCA